MRIVFMGTPDFAVASLEALLESGNEVAAVVTSPDKPAGRGQKIHESAVKQFAALRGLPVLQPAKLKDPAFLEALRGFQAELFVVVAFRMLPDEVWKMPPRGTINLHASLLPQYRGAAPVNWAIINGETRSGTTVFFINSEMDKGSIISVCEEPIHPDDTAGTLHERLKRSGAAHLSRATRQIASGNFKATPQDCSQSAETEHRILKTAPKIFRETCKIDWSSDAAQLHDFIRGLSPYPAAWTTLELRAGAPATLKILESRIVSGNDAEPAPPAPGTIRTDGKTFLHVASGAGWIEIVSLQPEGKKRMSAGDFLRGVRV